MIQKWISLLLPIALLAPMPAAAQETDQRPEVALKKKRGDKSDPAKPRSNPGEWVRAEDYPTRASREGRTGTTTFKLDVGADGVPTRCEITLSSGHADLDEQTCKLVQLRALFFPEKNRKGNAIAGQYSNRVRWELPENPVLRNPYVDGIERVSLVIDTEGRPTQCATSQAPVGVKRAPMPCTYSKLRFEPFRDEKGNAIARRVWITTIVKVEPVADDQVITQGSDSTAPKE